MSDEPELLGGRYELGRELGRGGMAEVRLATDRRLNRTVAVKILRSDLARDETFQERFRREAQSAAGLNHPAIVAVYDTGEDTITDRYGNRMAVPYIVMEYVEGRTLREFIRPGEPMEPRQAAEIMAGVLSALHYSHHKGIVHRDIKPGNIMITPRGQVKVMDFGIARAVADSQSAVTQTQAVMGTAQYLSPEQARGQLVDARSDIYSAACVLYEMLTGRPPFTGDSPVSIAYQHVREHPVPPSVYAPSLSKDWDAVVLTGLTKDREERYASAARFSRDLAAVVGGRPPQLTEGSAAHATAAADAQETTVLAPADGQVTTLIPTALDGGPLPPAAPSAAVGAPAATTGSSTAVVEEDPRDRRRPVWLFVLLGLALAAIVAAALLWFRPWDTSGGLVSVPSLTGKTSDQATKALTEAGLTSKVVNQSSDTVPADHVISTDPASGQKVKPGSQVTVAVSTGVGNVAVPDVTGKSQDEAAAILEKEGLSLVVAGTEDSPTLDKGAVIRSEPGAGTSAKKGSEVKVWLASGEVKVPSVVGQKQADAESTLKAAGLVVEVTPTQSGTKPVGTVDSQTPASGTVPKGSTVRIAVVQAAGPVTMPNLTGSSVDDATAQLKKLGLGVTQSSQASDSVPAGQVVSTDPAAGTPAQPNSTVTLIVSTGPAAAPTTSPAPTTAPSQPAPSAPATPAPPTTAPPGKGKGNGNGNGNGHGNG